MNVDRRCAYLEKKIQDMAEEIERLEKAKTVTHTISPPPLSLSYYIYVLGN